ncbi:Hypothetical predicted protein [Olea europaea subsp. europaea]|uniref:Uncharacterized protein n=1 Tax=Olea europaea subsp. europaea TaxID=158383 RepID=A0A8S0QUQ1_OLEEU|nr:Hypothetical predicted protein [Olea europaea subsp. europaea]
MSLSLLQGYPSAEEEEGHGELGDPKCQNSSDNEENGVVLNNPSYKPLFDPNPPSSSSLPSAFDAFSEVAGPPRFLNNHVQEEAAKEDDRRGWRHSGRRNRRDKKDLPAGAVVESKAQLVGIHERVRSDVESNIAQSQNNGSVGHSDGVKRVVTAGNPNIEDAAELLRCGIPKTYSHSRGIVCPVCGDLPPMDTDEPVKKKESTIKDKEKSKRMKGQSSHATWKSETEMQLRQQFD